MRGDMTMPFCRHKSALGDAEAGKSGKRGHRQRRLRAGTFTASPTTTRRRTRPAREWIAERCEAPFHILAQDRLPVLCQYVAGQDSVRLGAGSMKFKRVEHVAVAVKSIDRMRDIFENKLGIAMEYEETLPQYRTRLAMYPVGETSIELLESDSPDTETSRWIAERGEGLFHICLEVDDIDAALDELREKDVKLIDETPRIGHGGARIAFIDPESTGDLLIELAELPRDEQHAEA